MFEILSAVLAIAALIFARKAISKNQELATRVAGLEQTVANMTVARTAVPFTDAAPVAPAAEPPQPKTPPIAASPTPPPPIATAAARTPANTAATAPSMPARGFEEQIGTRWVVVLGGIALAIGGIFMVRYSIEQGLLGPAARTVIGGLFAAALIIAGEWARRRDNLPQMPWSSVANIPATLTAAGTAVAFATVYAAYALYGFLSPASAFLLLGAVAIATLAAALLHGPALAGLGVVGAFVTPVLVSSSRPDFWTLYVYIAVVTAAAFTLARIRMWRWLAITTLVFALIWTLPGLQTGASMIAPHNLHVLAGFTLAALLVVCGFVFGPTAEAGRIEPASSASLAVYLLGSTLIVLMSGHADSALTTFSLLIVATLVVAWRTEAATGAVAAAAVLVAIVFAEWAVRATTNILVVPGGALPGIGPGPRDDSIVLHLWTAIGFAAAFGVAGLFAQGRSARATIPVIWSAIAVFVPLALLIALYGRVAQFDRSIPFAVTAIALAGAFTAATEWLTRREPKPGMAISIALFATGALAALALGLTFALERGWLTISLALMSAGTAWVALKRPIPFLRWLSAIFAAIVVLRIGWEPRIAGDAVGATPIFNWLLYGYGVPALSFWFAGYLLRGRADDVPSRMVDSAAILFTALLAFMEIRHAVNGGDVYRPDAGLAEIGLQVSVALAMAIGLKRLHSKTNSIVHQAGASIMTALALIGSVGGLFIVDMPMISGEAVGGPFINLLLLGYALPALLAALLAWTSSGRDSKDYTVVIAGAALVLALAYVSLEIRRLYHGPVLSDGDTGDAEQYTYSVAWLAFGVVLLGAGLFWDLQRARMASAVVIALTIAKVFLIDMSELTGVYRALSFMGLGLVLVAIGWLYQRILFKPPSVASTPT